MIKPDTFFEIFDLLEDRISKLGEIRADDAWQICRGKTDKSYVTICNVFRETMKSMEEQGKAIKIKRGVWKIIKRTDL